MAGLAGRRVLVVEDEFLLAMLVEELLTEEGCTVVGPFGCVSDAAAAAREETVDIAVLDVNVAGETVFPVAEILEKRGIPFLFVTGYGSGLPDRPGWQACNKPYDPAVLMAVLSAKLGPD